VTSENVYCKRIEERKKIRKKKEERGRENLLNNLSKINLCLN